MISTLLVQVPGLPFGVLVVVVLAGPLLGLLLAQHRRVAGVLLATSVLVVLVVTLAPEPDAAVTRITCAVQLPSLSPTAVESIANILLFVPTALLAGVLLQRASLAIALAVGLSVGVEAVQALLPGIGRACDTSDLIANSIGALLGAGGAAAAGLPTRRRVRQEV